MLAQLLTAVHATADWSIQSDGTSWTKLGFLWLMIAGLFWGFSILRNRLPISFQGRTSPRNGPGYGNPTKSDSHPGLTARPALFTEPYQPILEDGSKEKRTSLRRKGKPVPILLRDAQASQDLGEGWVLDRSRGGLYLVVPEPVAEGTFLSLRPVQAPDTMPWVRVQVRRCRPKGKRWGLGCRFESEVPWGELLQFG
jgi:hypothetical protein